MNDCEVYVHAHARFRSVRPITCMIKHNMRLDQSSSSRARAHERSRLNGRRTAATSAYASGEFRPPSTVSCIACRAPSRSMRPAYVHTDRFGLGRFGTSRL